MLKIFVLFLVYEKIYCETSIITSWSFAPNNSFSYFASYHSVNSNKLSTLLQFDSTFTQMQLWIFS